MKVRFLEVAQMELSIGKTEYNILTRTSRNQTGSHRESTLMNANKKLAYIRVY